MKQKYWDQKEEEDKQRAELMATQVQDITGETYDVITEGLVLAIKPLAVKFPALVRFHHSLPKFISCQRSLSDVYLCCTFY